jgi:hypothetical protein
MILRAVHQSWASSRKEKIIHPEKIQREMLKSMAGLTCEAHLLKASKKMARVSTTGGWAKTSLGIEDVDGEGLECVDEYPGVACPEDGSMRLEDVDVDEIEFVVGEDFTLPPGAHCLTKGYYRYGLRG